MRFVFIYTALFLSTTGFTQTSFPMQPESEFILSKELVKKDITTYLAFFREIDTTKTYEKVLSVTYNYIYIGKPLFFVGYEVHNLAVKVRNNQIQRVHFEIYYSDIKIIKEIIKEYGYPESGYMNPHLPPLKDPKKGTKDRDNFWYENYTGLSWPIDGEERYMHITNLMNSRYFTSPEHKIWVNFSLVKHLKK